MWYEVKIKYSKQDDNGKLKNVSECYLFQAINFTDAETQANDNFSLLGEFKIESIKKAKLTELFAYDSGEFWFKIGICMIAYNEETGKESKTKINYLVLADDLNQALNRFTKEIDTLICPYTITLVQITSILDVISIKE